jgi:integration host factor subunit beta
VNCVFDTMIEAMRQGEGIEIRGFGSLTVRPYRPYEGRNPRTGAPVEVPAKRLPFFKVGKELRELVNSSRHLAITGDDDDEPMAKETVEVKSDGARSERGAKR